MLDSIISGAFGLIGANKSAKSNKAINNQNIANSREFAQNSIQWKVEDAKKAGIHPLYALGSPTMSPNPMLPDMTDYSSIYGDIGRNIGNSIEKKSYNRKIEQKLDAEIDLIKAQTNQVNNLTGQKRGAKEAVAVIDGVKAIKDGNPQKGGAFAVDKNNSFVVPDGMSDLKSIEYAFGDATGDLIGLYRAGKLTLQNLVNKIQDLNPNYSGSFILDILNAFNVIRSK
jgi:hypothetical protein